MGQAEIATRAESAIEQYRDRAMPPAKRKEWEARISKAEQVCSSMVVDKPGAEQLATVALGRLKNLKGEIEEARVEALKPINEVRSEIQKVSNGLQGRVENQERALKDKIVAYRRKLEDERRAEARRIEAENRKKAEKLRQQAEKERKAAAAKAAEQQSKTSAEEAAISQQKADVLEEKARQAEQVVVPEVVEPKTTKAGGTATTMKTTWDVEVMDLMELVKAIAAGDAPLFLVEANMKVLRSMKPTKAKPVPKEIPGVQFVEKSSLSVR